MGKLIDRVGQHFGRLVVLERAANRGKKTAWICECTCGNKTTVTSTSLVAGDTASCGCLALDTRTKHNMSQYPEYRVWLAAKSRCFNIRDRFYSRYGGRGITMDKDWAASFEIFIRDIGRRPSSQHSLDRIDNDRGYMSDNCRWATRIEQSHNTSANRNLTHNNITLPLEEWARRIGITGNALRWRIGAWGQDKALSTPKG